MVEPSAERSGVRCVLRGALPGFYHQKPGRPSLSRGVYFRLLLIGFFEGINSELGDRVAHSRQGETCAGS